MARLLHWPVGLKTIMREPLAGPRVVSGGSTNSIGNFTQTFSSPFALWRFRFSLPPIRSDLARRYRGWVTAMHGGANATRVTFCDWDGLSKEQRGISGDLKQPWSNGMPWSNGQPWHAYAPLVSVSASAALDEDIVKLADTACRNKAAWSIELPTASAWTSAALRWVACLMRSSPLSRRR